MRVGDLVRYTLPSKGKFYIGLIVGVDSCSPWIRWLCDNELEALDRYDDSTIKECFEVISEGR